MDASISVEGGQELIAALDRLEKGVAKKALRKGVTKGAQALAKDAKSRVRTKTKLLKKAIGSRVKVYGSGIVNAVIGPRRGFKTDKKTKKRVITRFARIVGKKRNGKVIYQNPTKYSHLVEFGTRHSKAYPFLRPALEAAKATFIPTIAKEVQAFVSEEAK